MVPCGKFPSEQETLQQQLIMRVSQGVLYKSAHARTRICRINMPHQLQLLPGERRGLRTFIDAATLATSLAGLG